MKLTSNSEPASRWAMSRVSGCILEAPRHEHEERREQAEHQRRAEELGDAEHAHLGDRSLEQREQEAAHAELGEKGNDTDGKCLRRGTLWSEAPRNEETGYERDVKKKLQLGCKVDEREVAAGIF